MLHCFCQFYMYTVTATGKLPEYFKEKQRPQLPHLILGTWTVSQAG